MGVEEPRRDEEAKRHRSRSHGKGARRGLSEMARARRISRCVSYGRSLSLPRTPFPSPAARLSISSGIRSSFTIYFFIARRFMHRFGTLCTARR